MSRSDGVKRRDVLRAAGAVVVGAAAGSFPIRWTRGNEAMPGKVLFFTKSAGFEHSVVKRPHPQELGLAEKILVELGGKNGFDVTASKDGTLFTEQGLKPFDLIVFYTTGDLTKESKDFSHAMPPDGKETLLKYVAGGKGFVGLHCASDTFHGPGDGPADPYIKMLGGEFVIHGKQQNAKIKVIDPKFLKGVEDFEKVEEWYRLKNFSPDLHVILLQDTDSMTEEQYKNDKPYPETWARMHGKGRVFYTSMGHRDDVWNSDLFHNILLGGMAWAAGNVEADVTPNLEQAAPAAMDRLAK